MARRVKNKVIVWRPFPSPTKRNPAQGLLPALPETPQRRKTPREKEEAVVNRWVQLADILNGAAAPKSKKKNIA